MLRGGGTPFNPYTKPSGNQNGLSITPYKNSMHYKMLEDRSNLERKQNQNTSVLTKSVQDISSIKESDKYHNSSLLPQLSKHQMSSEMLADTKESLRSSKQRLQAARNFVN